MAHSKKFYDADSEGWHYGTAACQSYRPGSNPVRQ